MASGALSCATTSISSRVSDGIEARPDPGPRLAVGAQDVVNHEGGDVDEPRREFRLGVGLRLFRRDRGRKGEAERRVGQERTVDGGRKAIGGVPKIAKPLARGKIRRGFEQDMAAQAPADEHGVGEPERIDHRPQRAGVARKQIGGGVSGVGGFAVAHEIDGDEPERLAQRPLELALEDARGGGIAVQQYDSRPLAAAVAHRDLPEGPAIPRTSFMAASPGVRGRPYICIC